MSFSRIFLAIPIPKEIRTEISEKLFSFQNINGVRLIPAENYHITVHFFGNIENDKIDELKDDISQLTSSFNHISMKIDKLDFFPSRHPKMIWTRFIPNKQFSALTVPIQKLAVEKWNSKEEKEQLPHITCARIKNYDPTNFDSLPQIDKYEIPVSQIELWQSVSGSKGVEYKSLYQFPLNG